MVVTIQSRTERYDDVVDVTLSSALDAKAPFGCFSKHCTSEMSRTLQSSAVFSCDVSYLFECNANDTYVLRMTHLVLSFPVSDKVDHGCYHSWQEEGMDQERKEKAKMHN